MAQVKPPKAKPIRQDNNKDNKRYTDAFDPERGNMGRRPSESDYPFGEIKNYDEQSAEQQYHGKAGRAYDRERDYTREHDEDAPTINQDPERFYSKDERISEKGDDSRYFGNDMGYAQRNKAKLKSVPSK